MRGRRAIEQEARFLVTDRAVHEAVARLTRLGEFRVIRRGRERQRNTYFDTTQLHLRRAGSALKLRQIGRVRELIFKQALQHHGHVMRHLEITAPIPQGPITTLLKNGASASAPLRRVRAITGAHPVQALFTLSTDRRIRLLACGPHRVEIAVDAVTLRRGGRVVARRLEVEVENVRASERRFRQAIEALRRHFGSALRPSRVSKFEFGFGALTRDHHRKR